MSDENSTEQSTTGEESTPDVAAQEAVDDRAARAAELAAAAQALFTSGSGAPGTSSDGPDDLGGVPSRAVATLDADEVLDDRDDDNDEDDEDGDEDDEDEDGDGDGAPAPVMPSFGLVFQAPDLSDLPRRRSRRATAAVTSPTGRPEEDQGGPDGSRRDDDREQVDRDRDDRDRDDRDRDDHDRDDRDQDDNDAEQGSGRGRSRRRRGGKGRRTRNGGEDGSGQGEADDEASEGVSEDATDDESTSGSGSGSSGGSRRTRSRGRTQGAGTSRPSAGDADSADGDGPEGSGSGEDPDDAGSGTRRRRRRSRSGQTERTAQDEVTSVKGSTRLEAKRQRRREGREAGRRRTVITEAEFLARRESVDRVMVVRGLEDRTQIAVLEDGVPVEHYVSRSAQSTMVGNVYLGRVQNVLPSMEAAFVDIGKGRNAVLYAGEVNWDAAGMSGGEPKRIENALKSGESVLVQVTKDPIGHKGARLTSQVSLPGRFLVYVPGNSMTGISRKLPENERARLKKILKEVVPDDAGVIVRTAAEGASEAELRADVERLTAAWDRIRARSTSANAPALLHGEPDMTVRVIRDVFNEDFSKLVVSGEQAWAEVRQYIDGVAPDLADRVEKYTGSADVFTTYRVHEAIAKAMDRKVWLPSGGSLVIDRTEAMTVVDVNTGKFTGSGGNLEETVTKNNIEAAEEIVRQLRLRDIGGIIVIDFIDMVLEANRDLVVRRLLECLGRDRTKHQVAEVTSLGLVQMTRKRVGSGLIEVFSETCAHCAGRGVVVQTEPVGRGSAEDGSGGSGNGSGTGSSSSSRRGRGKGRGNGNGATSMEGKNVLPPPNPNGPTPAQIAAAAHAAALQVGGSSEVADDVARATLDGVDATAEEVGAGEQERAPRTAAEPASAPQPERVPTPEPDPQPEPEPDPQPEPEPEPEPRPKRRRRGRVVAPAGPPTGAAEDDPSAAAGTDAG